MRFLQYLLGWWGAPFVKTPPVTRKQVFSLVLTDLRHFVVQGDYKNFQVVYEGRVIRAQSDAK